MISIYYKIFIFLELIFIVNSNDIYEYLNISNTSETISNRILSSIKPVRCETEEIFLKLKNHESTYSINEMNKKINIVKTRRKTKPWNSNNNPEVKKLLNNLNSNKTYKKPPNILFIMADDLGYGDLGFEPFVFSWDELKASVSEDDMKEAQNKFHCQFSNILTPNLKRMSEKGAIMTNFHSASPVCSPSRASIMTGLYPWRVGAMNAFELGRDLSQRNGFLPQIPTGPEIFRENGYFTGHSGKWHLGGMREEFRKSRVYDDICDNPGPNQHGFEEYISALDGPESPRYTFLMHSILHSKGHRHRIKDDIPVPIIHPIDDETTVLSIKEAEDAIQMMKDNKENRPDQPWLIQVWFNAPHGPWELLKQGEDVYTNHFNVSEKYWETYQCHGGHLLQQNTPWKYKSMVTAMDISIGMLLDAVKDLGYEDNTLIVFTSDNGPETSAGNSGPYKEGKRSLMEGGIRVPAIFQWVGHILPNTVIDSFGTLTDLYPTFIEAAELHKDVSIHMDGISLLPYLLPNHVPIKLHHKQGNILVLNNSNSKNDNGDYNLERTEISSLELLANRIFLWHKDTDPFPREHERIMSAGYLDELKIITTSKFGCIYKIFDLKHDPYENHNLVHSTVYCGIRFSSGANADYESILSTEIGRGHCIHSHRHTNITFNEKDIILCMGNYRHKIVNKIKLIMSKLIPFALNGNIAHNYYMNRDRNHNTCEVPTTSIVAKLDFDGIYSNNGLSKTTIPSY